MEDLSGHAHKRECCTFSTCLELCDSAHYTVSATPIMAVSQGSIALGWTASQQSRPMSRTNDSRQPWWGALIHSTGGWNGYLDNWQRWGKLVVFLMTVSGQRSSPCASTAWVPAHHSEVSPSQGCTWSPALDRPTSRGEGPVKAVGLRLSRRIAGLVGA